MSRYNKVKVTQTIVAGARGMSMCLREWSAVWRATPDHPWQRGLHKPYLVSDKQRLIFLDTGGTLSAATRAKLSPLLPLQNTATGNLSSLPRTQWHPECDGHAEETSDWHTQNELNDEQKTYHCFACVANPFERVVHYLHPFFIEPLFTFGNLPPRPTVAPIPRSTAQNRGFNT